jgi:hypothetical protein
MFVKNGKVKPSDVWARTRLHGETKEEWMSKNRRDELLPMALR